ncbi:hypothetical protein GQ457_03G009500 [Hibiscus cannabinus]
MRDAACVLLSQDTNRAVVRTSWLWKQVREQRDKVPWHRLIWFSSHTPKHSIITWMALLDRLPTKSRLMRMGIIHEDICLFCEAHESREHLFFDCGFSMSIWKCVLGKCCVQRDVLHWNEEVQWAICCLKGKSLIVLILKIAWSCFIYLIWEERNARQFRSHARSVEDIVEDIRFVVSVKLQGKCIDRADPVNAHLCNTWGIL